MAKNLFGNLLNSDDLDKKYQRENEENIKRANAEQFDKEVESFNVDKKDIVWATRFDNFAKSNAQVVKESQAYITKMDLYKKLLDKAHAIIDEDNRIRQEYALKKAQELQRQKEEAARKRKEFVLNIDNRLLAISKEARRDKAWVQNLLQINSDVSGLTNEEKPLVKKTDLLKELLNESSYVSSALACADAIMALQSAKRNEAFSDKYEEIKGILGNQKIANYVPNEAKKVFDGLKKDYLELVHTALIRDVRVLIGAATGSLSVFGESEAKLMKETEPKVRSASFDFEVVIPGFKKQWEKVNEVYRDYLDGVEKNRVAVEGNALYNKLSKEFARTIGYEGAEASKVTSYYNAAIAKFQDLKKSLNQNDLAKFEKAILDYSRVIDEIEKEHERLRKEAEMIRERIDYYINETKKKYSPSNYRAAEQVQVNDLYSQLRKQLEVTLAVSNGKLVYHKAEPKKIVEAFETRLALVKTDKQLKAEEIEKARIEEEQRRIAATKALNKQIDDIFAMAQKGDPEAMYQLAELYYNGDGVTESPKEAVKWYEKAAKKGHPKAIEAMGDCYYNGYGVKQSFKEAAKWYKKL